MIRCLTFVLLPVLVCLFAPTIGAQEVIPRIDAIAFVLQGGPDASLRAAAFLADARIAQAVADNLTQRSDATWPSETPTVELTSFAVRFLAGRGPENLSSDQLAALSSAAGWIVSMQKADGSWATNHPGGPGSEYGTYLGASALWAAAPVIGTSYSDEIGRATRFAANEERGSALAEAATGALFALASREDGAVEHLGASLRLAEGGLNRVDELARILLLWEETCILVENEQCETALRAGSHALRDNQDESGLWPIVQGGRPDSNATALALAALASEPRLESVDFPSSEEVTSESEPSTSSELTSPASPSPPENSEPAPQSSSRAPEHPSADVPYPSLIWLSVVGVGVAVVLKRRRM